MAKVKVFDPLISDIELSQMFVNYMMDKYPSLTPQELASFAKCRGRRIRGIIQGTESFKPRHLKNLEAAWSVVYIAACKHIINTFGLHRSRNKLRV
jgi:hypothetical protein